MPPSKRHSLYELHGDVVAAGQSDVCDVWAALEDLPHALQLCLHQADVAPGSVNTRLELVLGDQLTTRHAVRQRNASLYMCFGRQGEYVCARIVCAGGQGRKINTAWPNSTAVHIRSSSHTLIKEAQAATCLPLTFMCTNMAMEPSGCASFHCSHIRWLGQPALCSSISCAKVAVLCSGRLRGHLAPPLPHGAAASCWQLTWISAKAACVCVCV